MIDHTLTPRLDIGMTTKGLPALERMQAHFGGATRVQRAATEKWAEAHMWCVVGTAAVRVIRRLEPLLWVKAEQARAVRMLDELRQQMPTTSGGARRWTPELRERAEMLREHVRELNRRGPVSQQETPPEIPGVTIRRIARLVAGQWVTDQTDLFSDLGFETFSGTWPTSGFMTSHGAYSTQGISECPSGGGVSSSLVDVLEEAAHERYFLSPKAAAGILRRAQRRGRILPPHLEAALQAVASTSTETTSPEPCKPAAPEATESAQTRLDLDS
jgi:hypothetical protein